MLAVKAKIQLLLVGQQQFYINLKLNGNHTRSINILLKRSSTFLKKAKAILKGKTNVEQYLIEYNCKDNSITSKSFILIYHINF